MTAGPLKKAISGEAHLSLQPNARTNPSENAHSLVNAVCTGIKLAPQNGAWKRIALKH